MSATVPSLALLPEMCGPAAVPQDPLERNRIRDAVEDFAAEHHLIPPLSLEELRQHTEALCRLLDVPHSTCNWVMVLLNNAVWRETVAGVPYERRVLLLPQCLRDRGHCPAELDEVGLLCRECGSCPLGELQSVAEQLGYVVLIAEGTTVVTRLLESGRVDAIVGVSCLPVLERAFPYMAADAIPGVAIPLVRDGCEDTEVDLEWVWEAVHLKSDRPWLGRLDLDNLRDEVRSWFAADSLVAWVSAGETETERLAFSYVANSGKRWRPILATSTFRALQGGDTPFPPAVKRVAVAVECFHKASLVHDDIEDDDDTRNGSLALHREHGVPIALNVGDFLLGEGYRLLATCPVSSQQRAAMVAAAAEGHRTLCLGQGEELSWSGNPSPLTSRQVLGIFRLKTSPAFAVALKLGALCADADPHLNPVLVAYSESLGVAYQIRDDLRDFHDVHSGGDALAQRPSLLLALAAEAASGPALATLSAAWGAGPHAERHGEEVRALVADLHVEDKARQLLEHYKNRAIRSLNPLRDAPLKGLLRRIIRRILDD